MPLPLDVALDGKCKSEEEGESYLAEEPIWGRPWWRLIRLSWIVVESLGAVQRSKSTTGWLSTDVVYSSLRKILETVSCSTFHSEDHFSTHVKHLKVLITACTSSHIDAWSFVDIEDGGDLARHQVSSAGTAPLHCRSVQEGSPSISSTYSPGTGN